MRPLAATIVVCVTACLVASPLAGQTERTFEVLRRTVRQASAPSVLQVRVRWTTGAPVVDPTRTDNRFDLLSVQRMPSAVRPDRAPQLTSNSLVVVAVDAMNRELDWRILADPRVVRAEAGPDERLAGERLYYVEIDLVIVVPDLPGIAGLRVYRPQSNGSGELRLVGTVALG